MIEVGTKVRIKDYKIEGTVVDHYGSYNTVRYKSDGHGIYQNWVEIGLLDEELEVQDD